jgi:hypothetical protein
MNKLYNDNRFLLPSLVEKCFYKNKITSVDKQVCGNGFSTSFFKLNPKLNHKNILIAPNKAVIIDKHQAYINGGINTNNRVKFFYKESLDTNFNDADLLVFVADSFLAMKEKLKGIQNSIDLVLIDEIHSTEIQSLFRKKLVEFTDKVKSICNNINTSIVTVTASPNLYSEVDIFIENNFINDSNINISKDREDALKRIVAAIKSKKNVVVFSNSNTLIYKLRNYKNELEANFIMGENLTRGLSELVKIIPNENSNLTIVSSRGFEGFDINYKDAEVYFLEDRSNVFETFFISNLYQAINRVRSGAAYIEYNRLELSNKRKVDFKNIDIEVESFINDSSISITEKQKKEYSKFHSFVIFNQDDKGVYTLKVNQVAINLFKETLLFDNGINSKEFEPFLENRKIKLNFLSDVNNRISKKVKGKIKERNLLSNADLLEGLNLFGDDYILENRDLYSVMYGQRTFENRSLYLKHLQTYLRRKNYNGLRTNTKRELIALDLLENESKFYKLVSDVTRAYDNRSIDKYGLKGSQEYRLKFRNTSFNIVCKFIMMFANNRISLPSKWVANRDYNLLTDVGISEIDLISRMFDVKALEIDINTCFPRVLYALNGLELPSNFYGENKRNKLNINVFLNNFFYDNEKKTSKKLQRNNAILKFRNLGFNEIVIKYLIDNFFECGFRGDLFAKLSFYEKKIISEIKNCVIDLSKNSSYKINDGIIRRHDSVIIFNNRIELDFLNEFEYLGVKGWFNVKRSPVINIEDFDTFINDMNISESMDKMSGSELMKAINSGFKLMAM